MKHYGDITKIDGHKVPSVDVVCGGSPCQDLSVAGRRAGLAGERSGLFMEQIRIIKEMRDEFTVRLSMRGPDNDRRDVRPRYMVFENVLGLFSSNGGEDFRAVLEETAKVADETTVIPRYEGGWNPSGGIVGRGWSLAWRVHDSQFWGVPQQRKRISLVADFGGCTATEILFERECLPWDFETSEKKGKTAPETARKIYSCKDFGGWYEDNISQTIRAKGGDYGGGSETLILDEGGLRRKTPIETERCFGYPDGWTDIGIWNDTKGTKHRTSDALRYKALGNSIALPFWEWMAGRICDQYDRQVEMASLFDGIGGFPLCFQRHGAVPVWASEIEEFPIAVTKARFPEEE